MKKYSLLFLIFPLVLFQYAFSQSSYLADKNLKGNIRSYKESIYRMMYKNNSDTIRTPILESTYEAKFNPQGKIIEESRNELEKNYTSKTTFLYDDFGYRKETIDTGFAMFRIYKTKYDHLGNEVENKAYSSKGELIYTISNVFNKKGKIEETKTTYSEDAGALLNLNLKNRYIYQYDSLGNMDLLQVYGANGSLQQKVVNQYNEAKKLIRVQYFDATDKLINQVSYEYDNQGNQVSEQHSQMPKFVHQYDQLGRKIKSYYEENDYLSFEYNEAGLLISEKRFRDGVLKNTISYRYNESGQLIEEDETKSDAELSEKRLYQYDNKGNRVEKKWLDPVGNVKEVWSCLYDSSGNKLKETLFNKGKMLRLITEYSYDKSGRKAGYDLYEQADIIRGFPDRRVQYFYNSHDSLILIRTAFDNDPKIKDTILYNEFGLKSHYLRFYGNVRNTYDEYKYDKNRNLIEESIFNGDGSLQSKETYTYNKKENTVSKYWHDKNGEVYRWTVSKYNESGLLISKDYHRVNGMEGKENYLYNNMNQIVEERHEYNDGKYVETITSSYDDMGNLIQKTSDKELLKYDIIYY